MVLFKDLNKPAADLLRKGFPHEKAWDIEYKYKSKNPQITNTACVAAGGGCDASSTLNYSAGDATAEVKVLSAGRSYVDLSYKVPQLRNLKISTKYERKTDKGMGDALELCTEYNVPRFHGMLQVNPILKTFSSSGTVCYDKFRFGGELSGKIGSTSLKYALGASYTVGGCCKRPSTWMACVKTAPAGSMMFGKIIGSVNGKTAEGRGTELAAEVEYNIPDNRTNITFGGLWYMNDEKDTYVKSKISQNGLLCVALTHRLCSYLNATIGTQLDVSNPHNADAVKYGLKVDVVS